MPTPTTPISSTGRPKLFCPLAIGVVESRLDTDRFVRVHRSHIVNIDRIVGLKRMGDTGLIELAALEPYTVPVSRGRLAWLKSRLGETAGEVPEPQTPRPRRSRFSQRSIRAGPIGHSAPRLASA